MAEGGGVGVGVGWALTWGAMRLHAPAVFAVLVPHEAHKVIKGQETVETLASRRRRGLLWPKNELHKRGPRRQTSGEGRGAN